MATAADKDGMSTFNDVVPAAASLLLQDPKRMRRRSLSSMMTSMLTIASANVPSSEGLPSFSLSKLSFCILLASTLLESDQRFIELVQLFGGFSHLLGRML